MKIAIIGSRDFADPEQVREFVWGTIQDIDASDVTIVTGGAPGVDTWAEEAARKYEIAVDVYKPDYNRFPAKFAPLKRNEQIVDAAEEVYAFWDGKSRGTEHAIRYAISQHKRVIIFPPFCVFPEDEGE